MDEQDKRAERMIKLTIFLCSLLILLKAGQAVLSRYEKPEEFWLHEVMASMALWGKELYLPALLTEESEENKAGFLMEKAALFLGWKTDQETRPYVEDEYTRQELIEAGRGGSLSAIRKENDQAASEKEEGEYEPKRSYACRHARRSSSRTDVGHGSDLQ